MSIKKFPGAVISDVPVEPAGPYQDSAASGVWTLEQQAYWEAQGLWPVPGNTNPDLFIENLFSTYLYTGNDSTQTITNGIDLDSEGGMVWVKSRDQAGNPTIIDTDRGVNKNLPTNQTYTEDSDPSISSFNSNGFSINSLYGFINDTGINYASWTFRKAPKFFDVVTYTGNFTAGREIAHNLGSVPGMIIIKSLTDDGYPWRVYHQSLGPTKFLALNSTNGEGDAVSANMWNSTAPTDSVFTLGNHITVNSSSPSTYVAYLFAHDAGGFGDDGQQNVISCGSKTITSSQPGTDVINLGWEPQWVLIKRATGSSEDWIVLDNMRGLAAPPNSSANSKALWPNLSSAEDASASGIGASALYNITATGFSIGNDLVNTSDTYIYIAIRRGPMKTPESGTEVFAPLALNNSTGTVNTTGFPIDLQMQFYRDGGIGDATSQWIDRLRGFSSTTVQSGPKLSTVSAAAETTTALGTLFNNTGFSTSLNWAGAPVAYWNFRRAPGFFDVVAYSGDSASSRNIAHNLSASPELIMLATRTTTNLWPTYHKDLPDPNPTYPSFLRLNTNGGINSSGGYYAATPTESVFTIGGDLNASGQSYIAYLFATVAGVSKVGSYTGTGADLNLDCGFSAGARFVLIKRTDSTGDWYVWDSARGIVAGNDPYLLLNSPAAEEPNTDYIDPLSSGFTVTSNASSTVNVDTGTYIFLAIA